MFVHLAISRDRPHGFSARACSLARREIRSTAVSVVFLAFWRTARRESLPLRRARSSIPTCGNAWWDSFHTLREISKVSTARGCALLTFRAAGRERRRPRNLRKDGEKKSVARTGNFQNRRACDRNFADFKRVSPRLSHGVRIRIKSAGRL